MSYRRRHIRNKQSILVLLLIIVGWSITLGWGVAMAMDSSATLKPTPTNYEQKLKSVDPVPQRFQLGQELYLENCSSCHIALPPAIFPTETWRQLLLDLDNHYGQKLKPIIRPTILIMWEYFQYFSRPLQEEEDTPYRISESRFFKALHPKVDLPRSVSYRTCITCHPGTNQFDYRTLAPEWENAP